MKRINPYIFRALNNHMLAGIKEVEQLAIQILANPEATEQDVAEARQVVIRVSQHKRRLEEIRHGIPK
jgi:hypothetical protein